MNCLTSSPRYGIEIFLNFVEINDLVLELIEHAQIYLRLLFLSHDFFILDLREPFYEVIKDPVSSMFIYRTRFVCMWLYNYYYGSPIAVGKCARSSRPVQRSRCISAFAASRATRNWVIGNHTTISGADIAFFDTRISLC